MVNLQANHIKSPLLVKCASTYVTLVMYFSELFFFFAADKTTTYVNHMKLSKCRAKLIPEDFFPSGYGIAMPKGSPYKPFFDHS